MDEIRFPGSAELVLMAAFGELVGLGDAGEVRLRVVGLDSLDQLCEGNGLSSVGATAKLWMASSREAKTEK
jgi:hypothetical protein